MVETDNDSIIKDLRVWKQKGNSTVSGIPHLEQNEDLPDTYLGSSRFDDLFNPKTLAVTTPTGDKIAANDTEKTAAYLRNEVATDSHEWMRLCLKLQRTARGIPAVYPTALSAALATPKSERVYNQADWQRGMVGFSYDPTIPGTAGHIFFICGRLDGEIITLTNDAKEPGAVDYVKVDFYTDVWGQKIQFAATMLNGYDFSDFNKPPVQVLEGSLGENFEKSIDILKQIRRQKREKLGANHPLVLALSRDIDRMTKHLNRWKRD